MKRDPLIDFIADVPMGRDDVWADNLAIALCSYFDGHMGRPEDDEDDDETGWGPWVIERVNEALEDIAAVARDRLEKERD